MERYPQNVGTDDRRRVFLIPQRVMKTWGCVTVPDHISTERQISLPGFVKPIVLTRKNGERTAILFDFGFEFHGGVSLSVLAAGGDKQEAHVRLCFGESVGEALSTLDEKNARNAHSPRDMVVPVELLSCVEYGQTGYRFLYIEMLDEGTVELASVQGVSIYHPYDYLGSFVCSDEKLNKIYDTAAYTAHLCLQNNLWDGIKRDRLVWIGDMAPEMKTVKYVFGDVPEILKGLDFASDNAPLPGTWINTMPTYTLWWLINVEEWLTFTGENTFLKKKKDYVLATVRQVLDHIDETGTFTAGQFVDWPTASPEDLPYSLAGTRAILAMALESAVRLCRRLGADELKGNVLEKLVLVRSKRDSACGGHKQIAALQLMAGIGGKNCKKTLSDGTVHGFSTFMSYYILSGLARTCGTQSALEALRTYYGAMLDLGATTFWEDFDIDWVENANSLDALPVEGKTDIHGDNGKYCYTGFRHSLCHGWSSGPVPFLTEQVLGVKKISGRKVFIEPDLGELTFARGSLATRWGKVELSHKKRKNGTVSTVWKAPDGVRVVVKDKSKRK